MSPTLWVVAALIEREGKFLVAQRPKGSWMEGYWEFPGGKIEDGEDPQSALVREIEEELGIGIEVGDIVELLQHSYPDRSVVLLFFRCRIAQGEPSSKIGQSLRWVSPPEMRRMNFLPADVPIIDRLLLGRVAYTKNASK